MADRLTDRGPTSNGRRRRSVRAPATAARGRLLNGYTVDAAKVTVIPHGAAGHVAVDAADQLRPYFTQYRTVGTFVTPYRVDNDFNHLDLSLCTGPTTDWAGLWPHLTHDD